MASLRTLRTALLALTAVTFLVLPSGAASLLGEPGLDAATAPAAAPTWAPLASATIQPGVQMVTAGAQCTSNFVFYEETSPGTFDIFLGYAAHCAGTGGSTSTNGCTTGSRAIGYPVTIQGASRQGTLAYSSWLAMQAVPENPASAACQYNDFALVKLHTDDHSRVNPSVRHFGGPTGLCSTVSGIRTEVISYGNSGLRFGIDAIAPKRGMIVGGQGGGWSADVYMVTPGIPGDSGSGYMYAGNHCAWGVTSTIQLAPLAASNGISSLQKGVAYAASHNGPDVTIGTAAPITNLPV